MSEQPRAIHRDSGVPWMGTIPSHWRMVPLKYLATFIGGGTPNRDRPEYWNGDIPWVSPKDMKSEIILSAQERITREGLANSTSTMVVTGSILLVVRSGILQHTIPIAINATPVAINQDMKALGINSDLCCPQFLLRWVQGFNDQLLLAWCKQGATVESIEQTYLGETLAPLPPLAEQTAIAAFLDRETGKIDALVEEQKRLIELLKEKRQAVISQAVTKGLNPSVPMKASGVEWLGDVPEHWEIRSISSLSTKITNGYVGPTRDVLMDDGVRYLQSLHIKGNRIVFDKPYYVSEEWSREHAKSVLEEGDVLIVQTGDIGQVAAVPSEFAGCNCHALIIVAPVHCAIAGKWLSWVLNSPYGEHSLLSIQTGALHPHLNCGNVKDVLVPVPPIYEQQIIVDELENQLSALDDLAQHAQQMVELLQERRSALISAAVTGKIDVRQHANVETAAA